MLQKSDTTPERSSPGLGRLGFLACIVILVITTYLLYESTGNGLGIIYTIIFLLVSRERLRNLGSSAWYLAIYFVPFAGFLMLVYLLLVPGKSALQLAEQGAAETVRGQIEKGITHLDEAVKMAPDSAEAHRIRGEALANAGKYHRAASDFDRAVALDPNSAEAYRGRALVHANLGLHDRAFTDWSVAADIDPSYPGEHMSAVLACLARSEYSGAMEECLSALDSVQGVSGLYSDTLVRIRAHLLRQAAPAEGD